MRLPVPTGSAGNYLPRASMIYKIISAVAQDSDSIWSNTSAANWQIFLSASNPQLEPPSTPSTGCGFARAKKWEKCVTTSGESVWNATMGKITLKLIIQVIQGPEILKSNWQWLIKIKTGLRRELNSRRPICWTGASIRLAVESKSESFFESAFHHVPPTIHNGAA